MSVQKELDRLGKNIVKDAIKLAKPNKKTGQLERSLNYDTTYINNDKFSITIEEVHYGKYLNAHTQYMDKAIDKNIDEGISSIIEVQIDELLKKHIKTKQI